MAAILSRPPCVKLLLPVLTELMDHLYAGLHEIFPGLGIGVFLLQWLLIGFSVGLQYSGPLFTKQWNVLPTNLVKSRRLEIIGC